MNPSEAADGSWARGRVPTRRDRPEQDYDTVAERDGPTSMRSSGQVALAIPTSASQNSGAANARAPERGVYATWDRDVDSSIRTSKSRSRPCAIVRRGHLKANQTIEAIATTVTPVMTLKALDG